MSFLQSDLLFTGYSATAIKGDDPRVSGEPDNTLLSRHEIYEVVYFINKLMTQLRLTDKTDGQKIERMIHKGVPKELHSQAHVREWIIKNWQTYK
ncbi:MAG: hypothetical protein JWN78_1620 [Bacteroidota bacterium]|nr:hypothetical protein [Bacteroidota bacterium]